MGCGYRWQTKRLPYWLVLKQRHKKAKIALEEAHKDEFNPNLSDKERKQIARQTELLLNKIASGDVNSDKIELQLQELGVYKLEIPEEELLVSPMSQGSDITMNAVSIYQNAQTGYWHVTGGGYWKNNNWVNDAPWFALPFVGDTKNVGGMDTVGITYYNTSGTYNTSVISSAGYWHDGNGNSVTSYSPSAGDGKYGVAFEFQDKVTVTSVNFITGVYNLKYLGYGFSATITYDSDFVNWNGKARTFYGHTWESTGISSISLNGSNSGFGASVTFSSVNNKFFITNNSDTSF